MANTSGGGFIRELGYQTQQPTQVSTKNSLDAREKSVFIHWSTGELEAIF